MREPTSDLAALLADPARVADLPPEHVPEVLASLEALRARLWARLTHSPAPPAEPDRLLTVDEAAARLGVTRDWLRRRPALPFVVKLSDGVVRYSTRGLERFLRAHTVVR